MYYALYRKYRPKTFSEVIGQEHVTQTLRNQVRNRQFAHAYLFTGTRGTGKTSCAKILSRAINCLSPRDGEPCNECEICRGLLNGDIYDVSEIDAASNNGIDDIRRISDEIVYTPSKAAYKVYIIDEVHELSVKAFNALLKTLEEPPSHAVFILATTEVHKVPATILSRCQRFDMHRLNPATIGEQLKKVIEAEGRSMPEEIVALIATLADGSVRDGLSILDKVLELDDPEEIRKVLGICEDRLLFSLADAVAGGNTDLLFSSVAEFYASSRDFHVLCRNLLAHFRLLLVAKNTAAPENLIEKTPEEIEQYKIQAKAFSSEHILYVMEQLQACIQGLSRSSDKRADTEVCLLKCARPALGGSLKALQARIATLESSVSSGDFRSPVRSGGTAAVAESRRETAVAKPEKRQDSPLSVPEKEQQTAPEVSPDPVPKKESEAEISVSSPEKPHISVDDGGEGYREYIGFNEVSALVRAKNRMLSLLLSRSCCALCRGREVLILCQNRSDLEELRKPENRALIQAALEEDRKGDCLLRTEVGLKADYLSDGEKNYENIRESGIFNL